MKLHKDLTSGNVSLHLLKFAIPLIISNLFQALYNAVDMFFVGRYVGTAGLAAVAVCGPIMNIMIMTITGFSIGVTILIARNVGNKDFDKVKEIGNTAIALYSIIALVLTILGFVFTPYILRLIQTPAQSLEHAIIYLRTIYLGIVFMLGYNLIGALQRGFGDSKTSMLFVIVAGFTNMVLDFIFIRYFGLGVFGAAFATVLSQAFSFILGVIYFKKNEHIINFKLSQLKIKKESLKELLKVGIPMATQQFLLNIAHTSLTGIVNTFGLSASAAYGICTKIDSFVHLPAVAIGESVSSFSSQNIGAGKSERAVEALKNAIILSVAIIILVSFLIFNLAESLIKIFDQDPEIVSLGSQYIRVIIFAYLVFAFLHPIMGFIRGTGNSMISLISVVVNQFIIRIPLALFLSKRMGFMGIPSSIIAAPLTALVFYIYFISSGRWKKE